ncbi:MAG: polysaccharide biosynthesis/export family protein [Verrucomicrobia bacterium]|nr:polysaccharide biosynthesis/export family protein [Verrucomicrobiota bacterium]
MTRMLLIIALCFLCASGFAAEDAKTAGTPVFAQLPADATNPAPASVAATNTSETYLTDDKHKLVAGDAISFRIVEDRDPPTAPQKILIVSDSGELDVPYLGLVNVNNKTCRQTMEEITKLLEKDYYYKATVIIGLVSGTKALGRVYVYGEVRQPGPVMLPPNEVFTVSKAIVGAGGFGEFAKKTKVQVIQNPGDGQKVFNINMEDVFEKARTEKDAVLNSGDRVYVPKRGINF